ncbi:MAG: sigma-70 family RNA polymerase sigma factor [Lachnospiraceae bacterium]|nr:sigma-70 family RNA polymerase sigma factor [Lachnospiraceae bacterium]
MNMTNEQLVTRIRAGEDVSGNMLQLWQQVKPFVHMLAAQYRGRTDLEDLEQEGYLALYPAIDGYDPDKGVRFLTYAEYHISQAMRSYVLKNRNSLRLSFRAYGQVMKYKKFCNTFLLQYGQKPSDRVAALHMGLSAEQIREIRQNMILDRVGSLDAALPDSEDLTVGDTVPSGEDLERTAADRLDQEYLRAVLWSMVDRLPEQQPDVLRMKYRQNMTLKEIGEACGMTLEAIRQSERKGMQALRRSRGARQLKAFLPETAEVQAYRGSGVDQFNRTWTSSTERVALQLSL